ncbi:hypothetical protein BCR43DRAFT_497848 [Syncephalastrum racemosum]|uniref:Uncharacterized protein n=1 Tax=Syncephalastrum racemosum TaxID=13706 RepID=A0A1X2H2W1_SYNRA|nr:hypothetical protein BCR43DRAFT_497848 [Syncephalastrum racemosum]
MVLSAAAVDYFTCFCQCRASLRSFSEKAVSRNMPFGDTSRRWLVSPEAAKYQTVIVRPCKSRHAALG